MKIRVIRPASKRNIDPELMAHSAEVTRRCASPGTEVETVFLDSNPHSGPMKGNANEARIMSSAPHVVHEVVRAEKEGFDGVFLTGEYDVGAEIARHLVKIPVVDIGTVTARFAPLLGDRVGMLVIEDSVKPYARKLLRRWGLDHTIASMQGWNIPLSDAWARRGEVKARTLEICRRAIEQDEAEVILPFCAVFMPFIVAPKEIEAEIGIPVLDTIAIGLATTELFVRLGLRASPRAYPPTPPAVWGES